MVINYQNGWTRWSNIYWIIKTVADLDSLGYKLSTESSESLQLGFETQLCDSSVECP